MIKKSSVNLLYIFIFYCCLLLPGIYSFKHMYEQVSNDEKRSLKAFPDLPKTRTELHDWPQHFDHFFQDSFGFRTSLLTLYHTLKYGLKDSSGSNVIYGTEPGWLFYTNEDEDPIGDYRNINRFTAESLEQFINNLKAKQHWLAQQGIEYMFVITPSKHYIYSEFLPKHIKKLNQSNAKEQLATALKSHPEINYLDLTNTVLHNKKQHLLYFKADTHWNYFAANIAQYKLIQRVNQILGLSSAIRQWQTNEFKFQFNHQGDLAFLIKAGSHFEEPLLKPEFLDCAHLSLNQLLVQNSQNATHCDTNKLNVLIFHDSFFNLLQPFISSHFSDVRYRKQKFKFNTAEIEILKNTPDLIIEQYIDRILPQVHQP